MHKRIALMALLLSFAVLAGTGTAQDQFLFFEDLEPGMEGIGKTVIQGTEIRTFQVRIVGLVDSPGELNDFIEVRVSGDVIREAGGVASGMSGSPIYVDGKLIGALSRAVSFDADPNPFALVTPIGPMLELLEPTRSLATRAETRSAQVIPLDPGRATDPALQGYTELYLADELPSAAERLTYPERLYAPTMTTPVLVGGMEGRAFEWLRSGIPASLKPAFAQWLLPGIGGDVLERLGTGMEERYDVEMRNTGLRQAAPMGYRRGVDDLEPGASVGVTLVDGDVTVGSLGTVSYREGDVVLAYGHAFLFTGDVEYFLNRAYIYDTVSSLQTPFKYGATTERMGSLLQDRFQGIAGAVGAEPKSVRMNVRLTDEDSGEVTHYSMDLVRDRNQLPSLIFSAGLSLLDRTLNRVGKGTLTVDYIIRGAGLPDRLERTDIFTSHSDIAVPGPLQVAQVVQLLAQNEFQDPQIDTIDLDMSYGSEVKALRLRSIETDQETYHPGERVEYTVTFQPFRGETFTVDGTLEIPEDANARRLTLHAFAGPRSSSSGGDGSEPEFEGIDQIVRLVEELSRNDQLTVELLGLSSRNVDASDEPYDVQWLDEWVLTGEKRLTLTIEPRPEPEKAEPEGEASGDQGNGAEEDGDDGAEGEQDDEGQDDAPAPEDEDDGQSSCDNLFFC